MDAGCRCTLVLLGDKDDLLRGKSPHPLDGPVAGPVAHNANLLRCQVWAIADRIVSAIKAGIKIETSESWAPCKIMLSSCPRGPTVLHWMLQPGL
jgi:hypothetical protein